MNIVLLLFPFEWQFPAMNILIYFFCFERQLSARNVLFFLFPFWMAATGHEHIVFPFSVSNGSSRPWTNQFYFCFYFTLFLFSFHNKTFFFCFENKSKMNLFPVQWKTKYFYVLVSLCFQNKTIKVQSKINKFMSFWRIAVVGHHNTALLCNSDKLFLC